MTSFVSKKTNKEGAMSRRTIIVFAAAAALVLLAAAPAFAEGYNNPTQYTRANGYFSGPHGGYTTTTNKCQDCHSTHYASGSFMLLRANSREAACDYCHGGGGGSTINIMMDNEYKTVTAGFDLKNGAAEATTTMGFGTGHTLGYKGNAPVDIRPAYSDPKGFSCFDCHSPHGNSARIMTTMANPGRAFAAPGQAGRPSNPTAGVWPIKNEPGDANDNGVLDDNEWGVDATYGNFVWDRNAAVGTFQFTYRPIWPTGRWLLVKNPHSDVVEMQPDTAVTTTSGVLATNGLNKFAINWNEPLGPADTNYGGGQDNDNDNNFPFAPKQTVDSDGNGQLDGGFLGLSEFCTDCHDGAAGASTQKAEVWVPNPSDTTTGTYEVAYSHDAQPRH